jgi:glycerophosphoryl diester phosphodiesterase
MKPLPLFPRVDQPLLFAHRGVSSLAPENTMSSFRLAKKLGIPGIELDVHLTTDGELAVFHDHNLKRVCGLDALIETLDFAHLSSLNAGSWRGSAFAAEKIPRLQDLFSEFGPDFYYDIEIKANDTKDHGLEVRLAQLIDDFRLTGNVAVSSFNPIALKRFKKIRGDIPTAIIWSKGKEVPPLLRYGLGGIISGCDYLKPNYQEFLRSPFAHYPFMSMRKIVPWTVDNAGDARLLLEAGVCGIITNRPQELIRYIK